MYLWESKINLEFEEVENVFHGYKISLFLNEIMNYLKLENKNATDADPFKGMSNSAMVGKCD